MRYCLTRPDRVLPRKRVTRVSSRLFITRIGCLASIDKSGGSPNDDKQDERAERIGQMIQDSVERAAIVYQSPLGQLGNALYWSRCAGIGEAGTRYVPRFTGRLVFRVHWPRKNQEFLLSSEVHCLEDFLIMYDGYTYAITAECERPVDGSYNFTFGREGHRILTSILTPNSLFDTEIIGPTPMYPVFYTAFADRVDDFSFGRDFVKHGDTIESLTILPSREEAEIWSTLTDLIDDATFALHYHYDTPTARHIFLDHQVAVYSNFGDATGAYQKLFEPMRKSVPGFRERIHLERQMRKDIGLAYSNYAQLEEARQECLKMSQATGELFAGTVLLQEHQKYTFEMIDDVREWSPTHILEGLRFLADESRSRGIETATYVGPVVGALIALVATGVALILGT
jgi:hypothetical protein